MKMVESSHKLLKVTVEKEEIVHYMRFLLFPQYFQKTCTADKSNPELVWERDEIKNFCFRNLCLAYALEGFSDVAVEVIKIWPQSIFNLSQRNMCFKSNFSLSHSVFYPYRKFSAIFIKFRIAIFKLFQCK